MSPQSVFAKKLYTYGGGGSWSSATTWTTDTTGKTSVGSSIPTAADAVFILSGAAVSINNGNMAVGGSVEVREGATLHINGGSLSLETSSRLYILGLVIVEGEAASLFVGSEGIQLQDNGILRVNSGNVTTSLVRTASEITGSINSASYIQTGGVVTLTGNKSNGAYATFTLPYTTNKLSITGGVLDVKSSTGTGSTDKIGYGFFLLLNLNIQNATITGGKIICDATDRDSKLCSSIPLPSLEIKNSSTSSRVVAVTSYLGFSSSSYCSIPSMSVQPLVVVSNLSVSTTKSLMLSCNATHADLKVGGDFSLSAGCSYNPGSNTTIFNGSNEQIFTYSGSISTSELNSMSVESGSTLRMLDARGRTFPIGQMLTIKSGASLDDGGVNFELRRDLTISGTHYGSGSITLTSSNDQVIGGSGSGQLGNLSINKNGGGVTVSCNLRVNGNIRFLSDSPLLIQGNELRLSATCCIYSDEYEGTNFTGNKRMVATSGATADLGIRVEVDKGIKSMIIPMGYGNVFAPVAMTKYSSTSGTISVKPVATKHPAIPASCASYVSRYWQLRAEGLSDLTAKVEFGYSDPAVVGLESALKAAVFHDSYTPSPFLPFSEINTTSNTATLYNLQQLDGDYTLTGCYGAAAAFAPAIYGPTVACAVEQLTFSTDPVAGGSYEWQVSGASIKDGQSTPAVNLSMGLAPSSVTLRVTQNATTTESSRFVTVENPSYSETLQPITLCSGKPDSLLLNNVQPFFEYRLVDNADATNATQWVKAFGGNLTIPLSSDKRSSVYDVYVRTPHGCTAKSTSSLTVAVGVTPITGAVYHIANNVAR